MTMQRLTFFLAALTLGTLIHCGSAQHKAQHAPTTAQGTTEPPPLLIGADPRQQIQVLDDRINVHRIQLQLPDLVIATPGTDPANPMANVSTAVASLPQTCRQLLKPLCTDSCTLGAAICDDAGKLCELTKQLQPDAWADAKCSSAKQSCDAAIKRCCDCK